MIWKCDPAMLGDIASSIHPIATETPLRQILSEHFPKDSLDLPIAGGWGYSKEGAIKFINSPSDNKYDFVSLEYHIVQKIIYEELIITRREDNRFSDIRLDKNQQQLIEDQDLKYDVLTVGISCWHDWHWNQLKAEWDKNDFGKKNPFDRIQHERKRSESQVRYDREFWFDITEVFGN